MILFLAGPTDDRTQYETVYAMLRDAGYNALYFHPSPNSTPDAQRRDTLRMMLRADAVALLPGWDEDREAKLQHHIAVQVGMPAKHISLWLPEEEPS